jgi:Putative addiction module component
MSASLPLHEMSFEEKFRAMEALWEDLSREPDRIESPNWHQDVLKETESRVESDQGLGESVHPIRLFLIKSKAAWRQTGVADTPLKSLCIPNDFDASVLMEPAKRF